MARDIIRISERRPEQALAALDRLTGVKWDSPPTSLMEWVSQPETETGGSESDKEGTGLRCAGS